MSEKVLNLMYAARATGGEKFAASATAGYGPWPDIEEAIKQLREAYSSISGKISIPYGLHFAIVSEEGQLPTEYIVVTHAGDIAGPEDYKQMIVDIPDKIITDVEGPKRTQADNTLIFKLADGTQLPPTTFTPATTQFAGLFSAQDKIDLENLRTATNNKVSIDDLVTSPAENQYITGFTKSGNKVVVQTNLFANNITSEPAKAPTGQAVTEYVGSQIANLNSERLKVVQTAVQDEDKGLKVYPLFEENGIIKVDTETYDFIPTGKEYIINKIEGDPHAYIYKLTEKDSGKEISNIAVPYDKYVQKGEVGTIDEAFIIAHPDFEWAHIGDQYLKLHIYSNENTAEVTYSYITLKDLKGGGEGKPYTGKTTETAKVTVDNTNYTIAVDVLGEGKPYTGLEKDGHKVIVDPDSHEISVKHTGTGNYNLIGDNYVQVIKTQEGQDVTWTLATEIANISTQTSENNKLSSSFNTKTYIDTQDIAVKEYLDQLIKSLDVNSPIILKEVDESQEHPTFTKHPYRIYDIEEVDGRIQPSETYITINPASLYGLRTEKYLHTSRYDDGQPYIYLDYGTVAEAADALAICSNVKEYVDQHVQEEIEKLATEQVLSSYTKDTEGTIIGAKVKQTITEKDGLISTVGSASIELTKIAITGEAEDVHYKNDLFPNVTPNAKEYLDTIINEVLARYKREVVEVLPSAETADIHTIYLLKRDDSYTPYLRADDIWISLGGGSSTLLAGGNQIQLTTLDTGETEISYVPETPDYTHEHWENDNEKSPHCQAINTWATIRLNELLDNEPNKELRVMKDSGIFYGFWEPYDVWFTREQAYDSTIYQDELSYLAFADEEKRHYFSLPYWIMDDGKIKRIDENRNPGKYPPFTLSPVAILGQDLAQNIKIGGGLDTFHRAGPKIDSYSEASNLGGNVEAALDETFRRQFHFYHLGDVGEDPELIHWTPEDKPNIEPPSWKEPIYHAQDEYDNERQFFYPSRTIYYTRTPGQPNQYRFWMWDTLTEETESKYKWHELGHDYRFPDWNSSGEEEKGKETQVLTLKRMNPEEPYPLHAIWADPSVRIQEVEIFKETGINEGTYVINVPGINPKHMVWFEPEDKSSEISYDMNFRIIEVQQDKVLLHIEHVHPWEDRWRDAWVYRRYLRGSIIYGGESEIRYTLTFKNPDGYGQYQYARADLNWQDAPDGLEIEVLPGEQISLRPIVPPNYRLAYWSINDQAIEDPEYTYTIAEADTTITSVWAEEDRFMLYAGHYSDPDHQALPYRKDFNLGVKFKPDAGDFEYSLDGITWKIPTPGIYYTVPNRMYIRGSNARLTGPLWEVDSQEYGCAGDPTYLLTPEGHVEDLFQWCIDNNVAEEEGNGLFYKLFYEAGSLREIQYIKFTGIKRYSGFCFESMFEHNGIGTGATPGTTFGLPPLPGNSNYEDGPFAIYQIDWWGGEEHRVVVWQATGCFKRMYAETQCDFKETTTIFIDDGQPITLPERACEEMFEHTLYHSGYVSLCLNNSLKNIVSFLGEGCFRRMFAKNYIEGMPNFTQFQQAVYRESTQEITYLIPDRTFEEMFLQSTITGCVIDLRNWNLYYSQYIGGAWRHFPFYQDRPIFNRMLAETTLNHFQGELMGIYWPKLLEYGPSDQNGFTNWIQNSSLSYKDFGKEFTFFCYYEETWQTKEEEIERYRQLFETLGVFGNPSGLWEERDHYFKLDLYE